jgi:hypothetical protein
MYVLMDGTGVPVVPAETQGRMGKIEGQRAHTRECKSVVCSHRPGSTTKAGPCAIRNPPPIPAP